MQSCPQGLESERITPALRVKLRDPSRTEHKYAKEPQRSKDSQVFRVWLRPDQLYEHF